MEIPPNQRVTACRAARIAVYACFSSFGNGKRGLQATRGVGKRAHNHALAGREESGKGKRERSAESGGTSSWASRLPASAHPPAR